MNPVVQTKLLPFNTTFKTFEVEKGLTLQQVLDIAKPISISGCDLVVTVNNKPVRPELLDVIKIDEGMVVGIHCIPAGGGNGRKVTSIVVMVALVALTMWTAGAASAWAATAFGEGSFAACAIEGAVYVAGSLITSVVSGALLEAPKQSDKLSSGVKESKTQFIEGATNAIDPFGIIPVNLGTNRMFPKQAARPFTETHGKDNYCRQLFTWGYGKVKLEDMKIGETSIKKFNYYFTDDKLSGNLHVGTTLYSNDVYQENYSVLLSSKSAPAVRTTRPDGDEFVVDFAFARGLTYYDDEGTKRNQTVSIKIEYKKTTETEWKLAQTLTVTNATAEAFIKSVNIKDIDKGQYDLRFTRVTEDSSEDRILDEVYLSCIKTIRYVNPVSMENLSGTALYIKATDQLNGAVDKLNAVVTTLVKGYMPSVDKWVDDVPSSNPADLFRYVLQSPAFAKALPDERIDLEKLKEWWKYCDDNKLTYNRIIDYDVSIDDVLNDICAAGFASLTKLDSIYSVIIDNERPLIKGLVTPRNSWGYKGVLQYRELPHGLRVMFRNKEKGYAEDERIVYDDGYTAENASLYERIEFLSCTDAELAYKYGKRYFATARLQPETHSFSMDFENLTFNRGDRISFVNDVILVGVGQGRIKALKYDEDDNVTGFVIDDDVTIPNTNQFGVRIRHADGSGFTYHLLVTVLGTTNEFDFVEPLLSTEAPSVGSLCAFVEDGKELDLLVTEVKPSSSHSALITCIDYAPERFNPIGIIPEFDSNVTLPADLFAPLPPVLDGDPQSDETVMIRNSDGSYLSRMLFHLTNRNESSVSVYVRCRMTGATEWFTPDILKAEPTELVVTGLNDGVFYDFEIRYQRKTSTSQLSEPLSLPNTKFIGASTKPASVKNFQVSVSTENGLFSWDKNKEIDIDHYVMRYTRNLTKENLTWAEAYVVADNIEGNRVTLPIRKGRYLIKAVDILGNESEDPTVITALDDGAFKNVVEVLREDPDWEGEKVNCVKAVELLAGINGTEDKYYYFSENPFDLGSVYDCMFSADIVSYLVDSNWVREWSEVRDIEGVRGSLITIREYESIRKQQSIRGFAGTDWNVEVQCSMSDDNVTWTDWERLQSGQVRFRYVKVRLFMRTANPVSSPVVSKAAVYIDLPDRRESGENILIENASEGKTVTYKYAFKNNPSVNITLQDGAADDKLEYVVKNNKGFTVKVFNVSLNKYVSRSFDYLSAGYGKSMEEEDDTEQY